MDILKHVITGKPVSGGRLSAIRVCADAARFPLPLWKITAQAIDKLAHAARYR
jgi:hypothetical protein